MSLALHATGSYLGSASADGSWALTDISEGTVVRKYTSESVGAYTCGQFHPDGQLYAGAGAHKHIFIWDVSKPEPVQTFDGPNAITSLSFSENGYYLAAGDESGLVKIWDLRKLKTVVDLKVSIDRIVWLEIGKDNSNGGFYCDGASE